MAEAAVAIPFFTGLMVVFLFFFQVLMVQQEVGNGLLASGRELAVLAAKEDDENEFVGVALAKSYLSTNLMDAKAVNSFITGGSGGISLQYSDFSGDYIYLQADYNIGLPIGLFGPIDFKVTQKFKCRKWTGSSCKERALEDEIVYITQNGSAYHRAKNCTYLSPSVQCVNGNKIEDIRNENGEKYYACERCMKSKNSHNMMLYITSYGNRFHSTENCSKIKRTILAVRLREVGNRYLCSKCRRENL